METPKMVQRSHISSGANFFLNSRKKCTLKYVGNQCDAHEPQEASPTASCLSPHVPPAHPRPSSRRFDFKSAISAGVELRIRANVELAELRCIDKQFSRSSRILACDDVDDKTTKDLLPTSSRSRLARKRKSAETDCTSGQTPGDASQPNLTSDTPGKIGRAPRTPLPSGPTPQKYRWLVRRLYNNRRMSEHSGSFNELQLKLDIARNMTKCEPEKILRRQRKIINRKVRSRPDRSPITVAEKPRMMGGKLLDTGGGIGRMNKMISEGPDGQGLGSVADLEDHKDHKNNLRYNKSIRSKIRGGLRDAAHWADTRRAYKSSHFVRRMDRHFNQLKEAGGAEFLDRGKHCLSAKPWYMLYDKKYEPALGRGLTAPSNGVSKKRPGLKYDPRGLRSSLRMVTNVRGDVEEYVHATETDPATSIQSVDDEFNQSSQSAEEDSSESSDEESEESDEDCSDEDEDHEVGSYTLGTEHNEYRRAKQHGMN